MRRFLISIIGVFVVFSAFATGENVPTTKSYVDSVLVDKQDAIERTTGNNQALTNTGVAGEYGAKDIYDSTASYLGQTDALIDAVTMNTAVQNAIDSEFQCISWVDDDPTKDCLLFDIFGGRLPPGYTKLEYIESSGTQWIDTGVAPINIENLVFGIDVQYVSPYGRMNYAGFGTSRNSSWLKFDIKSQTQMGIQATGTSGETKVNYNISDRNALQISTQNRTASVNGTSYNINVSESATTITNTINLFRVNGISNSYAYARLYGANIYNGSIPVRNFIPARRDSDNMLGMYDLVSNTFFTNSGTGEFIAGPVATNIYLPAGN